MARVSYRYHAVGFGQDFSLFFAYSIIPLWATFGAGADAWALGLVPIPGGLSYFFASLYLGRLSDRVTRTTLARIGMGLFGIYCFLAAVVPNLWWLLAVAPLSGISNALVWGPLQAKIADESEASDLERNLGDFSLSWSAGKALGMLLGGLCWDIYHRSALWFAGGLSLALVLLVPRRTERQREVPLRLVDDDGPDAATRRRFLHAAWIANFAAYGLGATVNYLFPDVLAAQGRPASDFAWVLGAMFGAQTLAFWLFGTWSGWRYRAAPLFAWQAAGAAALLVIGFGAPLPWALPAAVVSGLALGHVYSVSIYYSVHSEEDRGARAGVHEALTGMANFAVPSLGGVLVAWLGTRAAPYMLACAVVAVALVAQARVLRGRGGAGGDGPTNT